MANNMVHPEMKPTYDMSKFRFWCQKVLPLVYDDSISYYEVLAKMVTYLNQVIDNVNADTENVETLKEAFEELAEYIDQIGEIDIRELTQLIGEGVQAAQDALGYANAAHDSQVAANQSALNASESSLAAMGARDSALGYKNDANQSAVDANNASINASAMANQANEKALIAEGIAVGKQNGVDVTSDSPYYQNNSKYYAEQADGSADDASDEALKAEGLAVGQQNGVDVDSSSPYYHKNAKYYAEQAGQGAGAYPLSELPDTNIVDPTNGQILAYDGTSEKWVNSDDVQGVTSLDALTDTDIVNPAAGNVLMYDTASEKWVNSPEKEVAISSSAPSDAATKVWINDAQQEPVLLATSAELNALQTQIDTKADAITTNNAIATKENKATIVTSSAPTSVTLADNTEYYYTNVASLAITFPTGNFVCWISLETDSGTVSVTFPNDASYIGDAPTIGASEKWEISIKNGVIIAGQVV